jgi:hypothetical protein
MTIQTTVTYNYVLQDDELQLFKEHVLEIIEDKFYDTGVTSINNYDNIMSQLIKTYLEQTLPNFVKEIMQEDNAYCSGIKIDSYFNTIHFDFCSDTVADLISDCVKICSNSLNTLIRKER